MQRSSLLKLNLLLLLIGGTAPAGAGTISVTLDPNFPSDYTFYTYTDSMGDSNTIPVSPYEATINGGGYLPNQSYYLWCYDINVDTAAGVAYSGTIQSPSTAATIEAAYLENQLIQLDGYNAPAPVVGPYSLAIWQLMNPSSVKPAPFPLDPAAQPLVAAAVAAYTSGAWTQADASQYSVWTPDNLATSQRFGLVAAPVTETREPATFGLIGLGLLAASTLSRRTKWCF